MATYKYCLSPYRVAIIESHPPGATYNLHVTIDDVRMHDTGAYCETVFRRMADFSIDTLGKLNRLLDVLGDCWGSATCFDDALEEMAFDYEQRKAEKNGKGDCEDEDYYAAL